MPVVEGYHGGQVARVQTSAQKLAKLFHYDVPNMRALSFVTVFEQEGKWVSVSNITTGMKLHLKCGNYITDTTAAQSDCAFCAPPCRWHSIYMCAADPRVPCAPRCLLLYLVEPCE